MPRDIQFLLKKYETRDVNEIWSDEHNIEFMQNIRTQERFELLDGIITERITKSRGTFTWPKAQKGRAKYLIKHFNFAGRISEKQYIAMIPPAAPPISDNPSSVFSGILHLRLAALLLSEANARNVTMLIKKR